MSGAKRYELNSQDWESRNWFYPAIPAGLLIAAARALSDLSHQLLEVAAARIEKREGHAVKLHG